MSLHKDTHEQNNVKYADDDRVYYLNLPHLVVGSLTSFPKVVKVLDVESQKIVDKEIVYNQTLTKQIDEAIQNSIDENTRTQGDFSKNIKISIDQVTGWITVVDDGRGIKVDDLSYVLAFTKFKTSSNFKFLEDENKGTDRTTIGAHGIGNKIINLFSSESQITSVTTDGNRGILTTKNNMEIIEHKEDKAPKSVSHGVTTKFKPDFNRLEIFEENGKIISDDLINHVHALLINIAYSNPQITFTFQGKIVKARSFSEFCKYYSDNCLSLFENDQISLAVFPTDGHKFVHIVNSLDLNLGGTTLSYITNTIIAKFSERLPKSYKITTSDIKTKLGVILVLKGMKNLRFGAGQTKEEIKNTLSELGLPTFDYVGFADKIFKYKPIKDPIVLLHQIMAEMEKRKALNGLKADVKEKFNPKLLKATEKSEFLMITEGDSAVGALPETFGRENISYLPLGGKLMNAMKSNPASIRKNARAESLIEAFGIGLEQNRSEKAIIATDADLDGTHICTLIIALYYVLDPNVLFQNRLYRLNTPVMVITDKKDKVIDWYYTLTDYQANFNNIKPGTTHTYMKGLGSFNYENLKTILDKDGLDRMIEKIEFEEGDIKILEKWMTDEGIDYRKSVLERKSFDIANI